MTLAVPVRVVRKREPGHFRGGDHPGAVEARLPTGRARGVEARQDGIGRPGLAAVGHEEDPQRDAASAGLPLHGFHEKEMVAETKSGAHGQRALQIVRRDAIDRQIGVAGEPLRR